MIKSHNLMNYYNQKLSEEGKGRFPGQSKYDSQVGGIETEELLMKLLRAY